MEIAAGNKIRDLRDVKEMSQATLAALIGVKTPAVSKWESGEFNPDLTTLRKIAAALDVRVSYLISDDIAELRECSSVRQVAVREALRLLLLELRVPEAKHRAHRYWRAVEAADAPVTLEGWRERHRFQRGMAGEKT